MLRAVPFAALYDGHGFVVDRPYAIAVEPALGLIVRKPVRTLDGSTLVAGLSRASGAGQSLDYVKVEVRDVAARRGASLLLDETFTHQRFLRDLGDPATTFVHIASHAHFSGDAGLTRIATNDDAVTPYEISAAIRGVHDDGVELLFLSACETAFGDDRAVLGLAGLAVQAGARSAVATLWNVNDQATSILVGEFYKALPTAASKAAALQQAQRVLRGDDALWHPNRWGAFLILGNWQ
jgi:CHAT domain-containing protein